MNRKICGVSKRHFRRCVQRELVQIKNDKTKNNNNKDIKENTNKNNDGVQAALISNERAEEIFENSESQLNANFSEFESENDSIAAESDNDSIASDAGNANNNTSEYENAQYKLRLWSINNRISHVALNQLLKILKEIGLNIQTDSRCLLNTPREVITTKPLATGEYYHYGLEKKIKTHSESNGRMPVKIDVSVDGLPLSKSSGLCIWPILASIVNDAKITPEIFPIGIYVGNTKPEDSNEFLIEFANEYRDLERSGLVKIRAFSCDAPEKSFISGTQSHQSYFGCPKCNQEGNYINRRVAYQVESGEHRTDYTFRMRTHLAHHSPKYRNEPSVLESVGVGMVSQFPVEPMHLLDLGVIKKMMNSILDNKCIGFKLSSRQKQKISDKLVSYQKSIPDEFCRKPRTTMELSRWKATELRQFCLYTGIAVLKDFLSPNLYYNFLLLHTAYRLLACPINYKENADCAQKLLQDFVKNYAVLFGADQISYNIHCLLHIADCCKIFGPIDSFSAYKFENYLQHLKKLVRKPSKILQQLHNRLSESNNTGNSSPNYLGPKKIIKTENSINFYANLHYSNFKLSIHPPNNCCCIQIYEERIAIEIVEIVENKTGCMLKAKRFKQLKPFFELPVNSIDALGIAVTEGPEDNLEFFNSNNVLYKFVNLQLSQSEILLIPLLHTLIN